MMNTSEQAGWTVYEPTLCKCVGTRVATISTEGGKQTVFILDLAIKDSGVILTRYFNVKKLPKGNCSVKHNSYFAILYRLTIGENPTARYSRAEQLLHHLHGHEFIAEYENASTLSIPHYFRVTKLKPVNPIVTDDWYPTGILILKKKVRYSSSNDSTIKQQENSNYAAINKQKISNELTMGKAGLADSYLDSADISIPQQHLKHDIEPLHHIELDTDSVDKYETTMKQINMKERSFQYCQCPNETLDQYHDRVIDESYQASYENDD